MIPKPYTSETDAPLEAHVLGDGAFERIVNGVVAENLRAGPWRLPPPGTAFPVLLYFQIGAQTCFYPLRQVRFRARARSESHGVSVPRAADQAARAASYLRRVRLAMLN